MSLLPTADMPVERKDAWVAAMKGSAEVMFDLCERTLDFERMLAGGVDLEYAPMPVLDTVLRAVAAWRVQDELKGWALPVHAGPGAAGPCRPGRRRRRALRCGAVRLTQVIQNLVGNAVTFTASGQVVVDVTISPLDDGRRAMLGLLVTDSGPGVPESQREHLFVPFAQGREGRRTRRGAGLGLSISARIVDAMGGTIELTAASSAGSRFAVSVPVERASPLHGSAGTVDATADARPPAPSGGGLSNTDRARRTRMRTAHVGIVRIFAGGARANAYLRVERR